MGNRRSRLLAAAAFAAAACAKEPEPAKDTAVAVPQAEGNAAAPAASSHLGTFPLLASPAPDGVCSVEQLGGLTAVIRNVSYQGDYPLRRATVGVGTADRAFRAINLEVSIAQDAGVGQQDVETLRVIFLPDGGIRQGVRSFTGPSGNEQGGLAADDTVRVKQFVQELLDHCKDHD